MDTTSNSDSDAVTYLQISFLNDIKVKSAKKTTTKEQKLFNVLLLRGVSQVSG